MTHKWLTIGLKQPRIPEFYTLTKINEKKDSGDQSFLGAVVKQIVDSLIQPVEVKQEFYLKDTGRFPFTKKFRKFRLGCKWNMIFRFVPLENFRKKWNSWKGSPVFPVETSQWKFVFHLQISRLYHQFHAFRRLSSGQASLVFQQKWRLIRVSFLEAFCKQTFRVTTSALPATL